MSMVEDRTTLIEGCARILADPTTVQVLGLLQRHYQDRWLNTPDEMERDELWYHAQAVGAFHQMLREVSEWPKLAQEPWMFAEEETE